MPSTFKFIGRAIYLHPHCRLLGNELLYLLTSNRKYKLRIDMEDFDGQKIYAEYSSFSISSSADRYRLTVSGYTGDAGRLLYHNIGLIFLLDHYALRYLSDMAQAVGPTYWLTALEFEKM